ncbi:hypothetical protein POAN111098_06380 [Polynucleobacter antarcticus]
MPMVDGAEDPAQLTRTSSVANDTVVTKRPNYLLFSL